MIDIVPLYAFLYSIQMTLSMEYSDKKFFRKANKTARNQYKEQTG